MKKLLLTGLALSVASIINAQMIKATDPGYAFDNFTTAAEYEQTGSTYGIFFYEDTANTAMTYIQNGIEYTNGALAHLKTRTGNGLLAYTITQPYNVFLPIGLTFGEGNSIDVTSSPKVRLTFSNTSDSTLYVKVGLKDLMGNLIDSKGTEAFRKGNWYKDEIAFMVSPTNVVTLSSNAGAGVQSAVSFTKTGEFNDIIIDFTGAYGTDYVTNVGDSTSFDYSKVSELQITVLNNNQVATDNFARKPLTNVGIAFSFIGIGDVLTSVETSSTLVAPNEVVSAYDMLGSFIGTGKFNELALENGKVYIVKSSAGSRKIVMNK